MANVSIMMTNRAKPTRILPKVKLKILPFVLGIASFSFMMPVCLLSQTNNEYQNSILTFQQNTFSAAGGVNVCNDIQWHWTLGETCTGIFQNKDKVYTVGYHQPFIKINLNYEESSKINTAIHVYPNPFRDHFTIHFYDKMSGNIKLTVFDIQGKPVIQKKFQASSEINQVLIPDIPQGVYHIVLENDEDTILGKFQIIKI